jgi:hypothetical protein
LELDGGIDRPDYVNHGRLTAGATAGVGDTASVAVKDADAGFKALVKSRLGSGPYSKALLAEHEKSPGTWHAALMTQLTAARTDGDGGELVVVAQAPLDLIGRASKYAVGARTLRVCRS